jgi:CRISPR-associated protein Cmr5
MLIKNNGLGATFAFVKAKISEKEGEAGYAYKLIYEQTGNWLKEDYKQLIDLRGDEDLVIQIISLDSNTYRAVTAEVISFFTWLSRFAEGMIKGDDSNGG